MLRPITIGFLLLLPTIALSQGATDPAAAGPPAELADQVAPLMGELSCTGKAFASEFGPEHPTKSTVTTEKVLGGYWYTHHVVEEKTAENPQPYEGIGYITWDAAAKQLVISWHDNWGARCLETSPGWQGDKLVATGEAFMGGQTLKVRDTMDRSGGNIVHTAELQDPNGEWVTVGEDRCSK